MCENCPHDYKWHFESDELPSGRSGCGHPNCPCTSYRETQEENMTTSDTLEQEAAEFLSTYPCATVCPCPDCLKAHAKFTSLKVEQARKEIGDDLAAIMDTYSIHNAWSELQNYIEDLRSQDGK